jgi:hypothetical protein
VDPIVGSTSERQFDFKGVIGVTGQTKPLRDYLNDILVGACGYFTWSFGKLRVGIRTMATAGAVEAFNAGNILFGSVSLSPVKPQFEKLIISFADQEYRFQANTADYTDFDLARLNNRPLAPITSQMHLTGCPTKSQALRVAVTRLRDLTNPYSEYTAAREGSWRSTILALNTSPGMVVSLTHDDLISSGNPTGYEKFRISGWRLFRDYSLQFQVKTVTNSMYDVTVGAAPSDVAASPIPAEPFHDSDVPGLPVFTVGIDPHDPTAILISGLSFGEVVNLSTISSASFQVMYADDVSGSSHALMADVGSGDTTIGAASLPGGTVAGDLLVVDDEVIQVGTITGGTAAIVRGFVGTTAANHLTGAIAIKLDIAEATEAYGLNAFPNGTNAQTLSVPLPGMRVVAVWGYATNIYGNSVGNSYPLTGIGGGHGLVLATIAAPNQLTPLPVSADTTLTGGGWSVEVDTTAGNVTVTLDAMANWLGQFVAVTKVSSDANHVIVNAHSGDTFNGVTTRTETAQWESVTILAVQA